MLEYEKKIMLTENEYFSILMLRCKYLRMYTQTNYYFDDDDFTMNKKGITCRIRAKDGNYKATIKNHNTHNHNCSLEVDLVEKTEFDPQIFNVFGLHHKGELITNRIVMHNNSKCKMVLDRNVYLGNVDFELEVEYCVGNEENAQELIDYIGEFLVGVECIKKKQEFLERVNKDNCKSQRFFKLLKKL